MFSDELAVLQDYETRDIHIDYYTNNTISVQGQ